MVRTLLLLTITAFFFSAKCEAQVPHTLLWNSKPEDAQKALEIMKKDPTWVNKRDSEEQTPLHIAARFNHTFVVEWLLQNGANVDAQAYNKFTSLHLTKNPEIVRLILLKKPNLKLKSVSGTVLQSAIEDLRRCTEVSRRAPERSREVDDSRKIVDMIIEHLGDDVDLISAVRLGQLERVRKIIAQDPSVAHGQKRGLNPLREAVEWGHLEICKFLVEKHKVDVNDFEGGVGYPIIKSALKSPAIVNYLIEQGADLQTKITWRGGRSGTWIIGDDATTLHYAVSDGVPETVRILLDAGVDPFANAHDPIDKDKKQTALEVAAFMGRTDSAIALLEHPAFKSADQAIRQQVLNKSLTTGSFSSSLAYQGQDRSELLEALMTHGAKFDSTESKDSPIQIAVTQIYPDDEETNDSIEKMVSVLRKHGHELDVFSTVAIGDFDTLGKLLETDPQASNSYSIEGYPALHMAVIMNYSEAVKILLNAGCDVEIRSKSEETGWDGETALQEAAFWGRDEIAKMLLRAGANVNAKADENVTPLHQAVRMGNLGVARLLLENGANKQAKDQDGKTPLEWISDGASAEKFKELFLAFENTPKKK